MTFQWESALASLDSWLVRLRGGCDISITVISLTPSSAFTEAAETAIWPISGGSLLIRRMGEMTPRVR